MDATDVAQVGRVLLVMDMLLNLSEFCSIRSEVSALLALGAKLFNGDCVAATSATRCRFSSKKSHSVPLFVQKMLLAVRAHLRFDGLRTPGRRTYIMPGGSPMKIGLMIAAAAAAFAFTSPAHADFFSASCTGSSTQQVCTFNASAFGNLFISNNAVAVNLSGTVSSATETFTGGTATSSTISLPGQGNQQ